MINVDNLQCHNNDIRNSLFFYDCLLDKHVRVAHETVDSHVCLGDSVEAQAIRGVAIFACGLIKCYLHNIPDNCITFYKTNPLKTPPSSKDETNEANAEKLEHILPHFFF